MAPRDPEEAGGDGVEDASEARQGQKGLRAETTEIGSVARTIAVEVDASRVEKAFARSYRDLGRRVRVRGFRPGKVPRSVLEKLYGASMVEEVEQLLVSQTLWDAIELADVEPVSEPDVDAQTPVPDASFRYTIRVEVKPEIELPELTGLPGQRPKVEVTDADVDEYLESLRQRMAPLIEIAEDATAELGHTLTIDYTGRVDGELFEGGQGKDVEVELGSGRLIPGFEDQLVGSKAGQEPEVRVTLPEEVGAEELRGREAEFSVHVTAVRERAPAELDDEFAKDLGDFESLEELRSRIRTDLLADRQQSSDAALRKSLVDALIERTEFEVPPGVVERQLQSRLQTMHRQLEGRVPEDALSAELGRMREAGRAPAERRVRESYLLQAVAESQQLSVTPEELDERLGELAAAEGYPAADFSAMAREQGWSDAIEAELLEQRALDFLAAEATVEESES